MPANEDVNAFAVKWFDKFRDIKTVSHEVEDPAFADECFSLGFEMDCGKAFETAYPDMKAFSDYRELDKIIDSIDDIHLLGCALFSRWRYFTHWAGPARIFFHLRIGRGLLRRLADWNACREMAKQVRLFLKESPKNY